MDEYLNLERRFMLLAKYTAQELFTSDVLDERLPWSKVLDGRFSVIVGRANFGKTMELRAASRTLRARGAAAFYVALHKVLSEDVFADALEEDDREALDAWRASGGELTVFVDSLDEAALGTEDGIRKALRRVTRELRWPNADVRWVLSSRPAVLSEDTLALLQSEFRTTLYTSASKNTSEAHESDSASSEAAGCAGESDDDELCSGKHGTAGGGVPVSEIGSADAASKTEDKKVPRDQLKVYKLLALDKAGAALYLERRLDIQHAKETLSAAKQYGLGRLAEGPGGLDILAHIDPARNPPECLTRAFEKVVEAVQQQQRSDPRERRVGSPPPENLDEAIARLAAASAVCQLPNIEISSKVLRYRDGVLSARPLIASVLSEDSLAYLLGSRLFIDSAEHQVKLYPDELLPFLAAKRLAGLVKSPEHARRLLAYFTWRATTGECGVHRPLLPLAGWLSVLNSHCRQQLLTVEPQAVAFFGDLRHPQVQLHEAAMALERSIERLVADGDSLGRAFYTLTAENYWQAAKPGIVTTLQRLFRKYAGDWHARDALLDIASYGRLEVLRDAVLDAHGHDYSKLLDERLDLSYILALGRNEDFQALAAALKAKSELSESQVARVLGELAWKALDAKSIAAIAAAHFGGGRESFYIDWALTGSVAAEASDADLYNLTRSFLLRLVNTNVRKGRSAERYRAHEKFVELVSDLLALLIERRAVHATRAAKLCLVLNRHMNQHQHGSADVAKLRAALEANKDVRLAFLRGLIYPTDKTADSIHRSVFWYHSIYQHVADDESELGEPGFTELIKRFKEAAAKPTAIQTRRREHGFVIDEKSKATLMSVRDGLRNASNMSAFAWVAQWLNRTVRQSGYSECNFELFEQAAGQEIAAAVRDGLSVLWRAKDPTWSEDQPNSTYNITIAGLQGLHLDLRDGTRLPVLTEVEVRRAIRYAQFEINGYPKWFWSLVAAHEQIATTELQAVLANASRGQRSFNKAETLIRRLDEAPIGVQHSLAPAVWDFVVKNTQVAEYTSDAALTVAAAKSGVIDKTTFEREAWRRIASAFNQVLPQLTGVLATVTTKEHDERQKLEKKIEELKRQRATAVIWGSFWLETYPGTFGKRWETWRAKRREQAEQFMLTLAAHLGDDRTARLRHVSEKGSVGLNTLRRLYDWVHAVVPEEEDVNRETGEVYSLGERDDAQRLRDALVPAIAYAKSEEAYQVLDELRRKASGPRAKYLRRVQFMMREEQNAIKPIPQEDYLNFEQTFAPPVSTYREFAMAVETDLLNVKSQIETGDFSLKRFFNSVNFKRIRTDNDGLALEEDFQALLGSELNHAAGGRYVVALEPILPAGTRRDVLCQKDTYRATVELKLSVRWTLQDYLEALQQQLQGQYMQAPNSKIGFFVIVLQVKRTWDGPDGKKIDFEQLLRILREEARRKEIADSSVYLRVIGIDATPQEDFRAARKQKVRDKSATAKRALKRAKKKANTKRSTLRSSASKKRYAKHNYKREPDIAQSYKRTHGEHLKRVPRIGTVARKQVSKPPRKAAKKK
jgi:hypothetical protein